MLVKTFGSAVYGVEAITIAVEVNINNQGKSEEIGRASCRERVSLVV